MNKFISNPTPPPFIKGGLRGIKILITFLFAVSMLLLSSWPAYAASTVVGIEVTGNISTPIDSIVAKLKTRKGGQFSRENVEQDVRALWETGQFEDVVVDKKDVAGGVVLTYKVVEKPLITKISFKGNKKLKKDDLEKEITIHAYRPLSEKSLAESFAKIREAYVKKGLYLVDLSHTVNKTGDNEAELIINVNEHAIAVIRKVEFIGNHAFKDKELKKKIRSKEKSPLGWLYGAGKYKEEQLEQDVMMLTYHYLNNGYLKVKVAEPRVQISKDKRYIYLTYTVEEGKQYKISEIDVDGEILTTKPELKALIKTKPKTIYNEKSVEEDMMKLVDFYGESGYAFVNVRPQTEPNDETLTTPLIFQIEKGPRVKIEKINISGNTTTRDKVIRRELQVKEGDIYNTRLVNLSKDRLKQLGYFEEVNFATPRGSTDESLVLNITVKEKSTGTFNIGAGFSTAENFIFSASIAKENFFGYGIGGQLSAEISKLRQQFMLSYRDSYFLDSQWMLNTSVYRTLYRYDDFDRKAYGGSLGIGHRIFENSSVNLGYQVENVEVGDFSSIVPDMFRANSSGVTSEMSLTIARDTRDNRIFPSKGMYHMVQNELAGKYLGGSNHFYRVEGNSRLYYPLFWNIIARGNAIISYTRTLDDRTLPLYERYFIGGPYSLRGFIPRSIGPKLRIPSSPTGPDADFVYGGNKQLLFNGELEFPIYAPAGVKWVFFLDAGNAYAETENYSFKNMRADWGLGLRWVSPMGPLRFEWGVPFSKKPGEDSLVFNFTIGSLF